MKADSTFELSDLWDELDSTVYFVLDGDGPAAVNAGNAQARHFNGDLWLYVDDSDGHKLVEVEEVEEWCLCTSGDERLDNVWRDDGVWRDGKKVSR